MSDKPRNPASPDEDKPFDPYPDKSPQQDEAPDKQDKREDR
ncbi:hypothetical protein [Brytella acorum]|uniref:Uncharacterized protein n=1 Tax=Brytella acorum TaxID=2959299 RepID=A0AA35VCN8_9PROT|nr:hypothetical protein [Brytella acorum]MDF3623983.1 hypothetical protein [Brytella acorum]CAI9120914.1 hypothetical protein LMG32879_001754 [Brytella acorum]